METAAVTWVEPLFVVGATVVVPASGPAVAVVAAAVGSAVAGASVVTSHMASWISATPTSRARMTLYIVSSRVTGGFGNFRSKIVSFLPTMRLLHSATYT